MLSEIIGLKAYFVDMYTHSIGIFCYRQFVCDHDMIDNSNGILYLIQNSVNTL